MLLKRREFSKVSFSFRLPEVDLSYDVYDFTDAKRTSVIMTWIEENKLQRRDVGQLNQKLDMLRTNGPTLHPRLLAGPINKQRHIYKLIIHGQRMLRPMLCKGPFRMDNEYTLLLGAIEINFQLSPDPSLATKNRNELLADKTRRTPNERY
jgi:hypothetical protein